jgi:capsular polysaccharide transport system permease protein
MSVSDARFKPSPTSRFAAWGRVVVALMIREGVGKNTNRTLGFFWVIGEPITLICGVMFLWSLRGRDAGHPGTPVMALAITAYTHIQLWRRTVFPALTMIHDNRWLFYHPTVHSLDVILANCFMEGISIFAAFLITYNFCVLVGALEPVRDWGLVLAAWSLDIYWCFCFCILIAGIALLNEFAEKWMHPAMYLTLPITGAFIMTAWVTPGFRKVLEWVGLANCCEMLRAGVFSLDVKTYWSVPLIVVESTIFLVIGLPILEYARRNLHVGG